MRTIYPEHQTKVRRKELRQKIRNALGTSSDDAPRLGTLFNVVSLLDHLMRMTSDNRYGVAVVSTFSSGQGADKVSITPEEKVSALDHWREDNR